MLFIYNAFQRADPYFLVLQMPQSHCVALAALQHVTGDCVFQVIDPSGILKYIAFSMQEQLLAVCVWRA